MNNQLIDNTENIFEEADRIEKASLKNAALLQGTWFLGIALLSIINTFFLVFNKNAAFLLGLGFTQVTDGLIMAIFGSYNALAFTIDMLLAGVFIFIGIMAVRMSKTAFIVGMVLYGIDTLIFIAFFEWLAFLFHLFVLYSLWRGLQTVKRYHAIP